MSPIPDRASVRSGDTTVPEPGKGVDYQGGKGTSETEQRVSANGSGEYARRVAGKSW